MGVRWDPYSRDDIVLQIVELAAASMGDLTRGGGWQAGTYLENEGCSNDVVHPECHSGQQRVVMSNGVVSCHRNFVCGGGVA